MTDAEILANAPEGATHANSVGEYGLYSQGDYFSRWTPDGMLPTTNCNWRSLADIRELESLRKQLATSKANVIWVAEDPYSGGNKSGKVLFVEPDFGEYFFGNEPDDACFVEYKKYVIIEVTDAKTNQT